MKTMHTKNPTAAMLGWRKSFGNRRTPFWSSQTKPVSSAIKNTHGRKVDSRKCLRPVPGRWSPAQRLQTCTLRSSDGGIRKLIVNPAREQPTLGCGPDRFWDTSPSTNKSLLSPVCKAR